MDMDKIAKELACYEGEARKMETKIETFINSLQKSDLEEARKMETKIIEEGCKNYGICWNFLTCDLIPPMETSGKDLIRWKELLQDYDVKRPLLQNNPIRRPIFHPNFVWNRCYYENIETEIIGEVNRTIDEVFLRMLDEKCTKYESENISPCVFMQQLAKMRSACRCESYAAIWNIGDFYDLMCNPDWKEYVNPNKVHGYAGWQQEFFGVCNFISPDVPVGTLYLTTRPVGYATICKSISVNYLNPPREGNEIVIAIDVPMCITLKKKINVIKIMKKEK